MRNSRAIGVRIMLSNIQAIQSKAKRRNWTFNRWMNWAVKQGLRNHCKKEKGEG